MPFVVTLHFIFEVSLTSNWSLIMKLLENVRVFSSQGERRKHSLPLSESKFSYSM